MKRIIDGKTYNTETATLVCEWSEGYLNDHKMYQEGIYITKNGRWFRAGAGGPASMYARQVDNSYIGGNGIFPMTEEEVMHYLETRNQVEALETHFAHRIEEA